MSAYKTEVPEYLCDKCHLRKAKYEVFNKVNASCGHYCLKCADMKIKSIDRIDAL